jgi:hypothetical protein
MADTRWRQVILPLAGIVILGVSVTAGVHGFDSDFRLASRSAPRHAIPPELDAEVRRLRTKLPPNASIFFLGYDSPPDVWHSRLWQRALYPTRVVILERQPGAVIPGGTIEDPWAGLRELQRTLSIRYALSAGNPPDDPGFLSRVEMPRIPGYPYIVWFGELRP